MALTDKYSALIAIAKQHNVSVKEDNGVLRIKGEVPTTEVKDEMWKVYNQLDPNFKSGEVVLNVETKSLEQNLENGLSDNFALFWSTRDCFTEFLLWLLTLDIQVKPVMCVNILENEPTSTLSVTTAETIWMLMLTHR